MVRQSFLDEQLNYIYLEEGIQDIVNRLKNVVVLKKIEASIKSKNLDKIIGSIKFIPIISPDEIEMIARRKISGFDLKYKKVTSGLRRKVENTDMQLLATTASIDQIINDQIEKVEDIKIKLPKPVDWDKALIKLGNTTLRSASIHILISYILKTIAGKIAAGSIASLFGLTGTLIGSAGVIGVGIAILFFILAIAIRLYKKYKNIKGIKEIKCL